MNLTISNPGPNAVRIIVDGDTVNSSELAAGNATGVSGNVIEVRELGVLDPSQQDGGNPPALA